MRCELGDVVSVNYEPENLHRHRGILPLTARYCSQIGRDWLIDRAEVERLQRGKLRPGPVPSPPKEKRPRGRPRKDSNS